jgi:hypothetical protein
MAVKWEITPPNEIEARHRATWGDEEYERRKRVAAEKADDFPDSEWETACVVGGQFEPLAMAAGQEIFDQLAEKDYRFWEKLVHRVIRKR